MTASTTAEEVVARFVRQLDVEPIGIDRFAGLSQADERYPRLFGGLVLGQAAIAAGRTAPDPTLHSLHAYFLRGGRSGVPIEYTVERVRDGRTFTSRRVLARQAGEPICDITASFVHPEEGIAHQGSMPAVPGPDALRDAREQYPHPDGFLRPVDAIEWRLLESPEKVAGPGEEPVVYSWFRIRAPLPDDHVLHTAALIYASDDGSFDAIERRYGWAGFSDYASASLDHALWIHRPIRWDGWFLSVTYSPVAHAARALSLRDFYTQDGTHVATMAQEAVVRRERG